MVAAAIIGGAVVGGLATSRAGSKAADAQVEAADRSSQTQQHMFDVNREDMTPWRDAGRDALDRMTDEIGPGGDYARDFKLSDFQKDPGYAFRMREGLQALERSGAARGGLLGGRTGKELQRYGQDYASGEYSTAYNRFNADRDRRFNRLASIAGVGQTATRDVANMGTQTANSIAENQIGVGNARAAGAVAQGNAVGGAANSIGNWFMMNKFLGGNSGGGGSGGGFTGPPNPYYGGGMQGGFGNPAGGSDFTVYG